MSGLSKIDELKKIIESTDNIVFFGGAGVSTESGIPDFRSRDGLYNVEYDYPPETIISHSFFHSNTKEFYRFYRKKMVCLDAKPNKAHLKLAELEMEGKLKAVVTQNIDGLHQMAGSSNVVELHGSIYRNYCVSCRKAHDIKAILDAENIPLCECGSLIKPDVILYEEGLDTRVIERAVKHIKKADVLIIGGTSLVVYPAAGLVNYFNGSKLVIINRSPTNMDSKADLLIEDSIGEVLGAV